VNLSGTQSKAAVISEGSAEVFSSLRTLVRALGVKGGVMVNRESLVTWDFVVRAEARRRGRGEGSAGGLVVEGGEGGGEERVVWKRERRVRVVVSVRGREGGGMMREGFGECIEERWSCSSIVS
jgi:hypothetical protein